MNVTQAVERDLSRLPLGMRDSALAALALAMAAQIDFERNSATSKSMCARVLLDALERLRDLASEEPKDNRLYELERKRALRLAVPQG